MRKWAFGTLLATSCVDAGAPTLPIDDTTTMPGDADDSSSAPPPGDTSTTAPADRMPDDAPPPLLARDRFATSADTPLRIGPELGVLANDEGDGLVVTHHDATTEAGGTLAIADDGSLVYTPPSGFGGCDRARYTAAGPGGSSDEAEVVFAVHRGGALGSPHAITAIADAHEGAGLLGRAAGDRAGTAVTIVGDMNGDGTVEVAIGSSGASPRGRASAGRVDVWSYGEHGVLGLDELGDRGGFTIDGDLAGASAGDRVAPAGDVNGDGLADLLVAAPRTNLGGGPQGDHVGRVFVVFGSTQPASIDLADVFAPAHGQAFTGEFMGDHAGTSIASAGDLDGDGLDDLVVGAPLWGPGEDRPGRVYVVFSRPQAGAWRFDQMLASGHAIAIEGEHPAAELGRVVVGVGDLDGDGDRELAIGSPTADGWRGRVWIVDGPHTGGRIDDLVLAGRAHAIDGELPGDGFGGAIAVVGDVDDDGTDDLAIGAASTAGGRGRAWILSGRAVATASTPAEIDHAIAIDGAARGDAAGVTIAAAGDLDGDGVPDVWVGASGTGGGAGRSHAVMLGALPTTGGTISLGDVHAGIGGFALVGTDAMGTGRAIAGGSDLDGDGVPDAILGSPGASERGDYSGRADLVGGAAVLCD